LAHWRSKEVFLFEKKKQKTFALLVDAAETSGTYANRKEVFWFFFKKELLFLRLPTFGTESLSMRAGITCITVILVEQQVIKEES